MLGTGRVRWQCSGGMTVGDDGFVASIAVAPNADGPLLLVANPAGVSTSAVQGVCWTYRKKEDQMTETKSTRVRLATEDQERLQRLSEEIRSRIEEMALILTRNAGIQH